MTRAWTLALALASAPAVADEGELSVAAAAGIELATIEHPLAAASTTAFDLAPLSLVPRVAVGARYGLTNEIQLGLGLNAAASANVTSGDVVLGGAAARLVTGTYVDVGLPLALTWRVDSGFEFSGAATIELGPMLALWLSTAVTDPTKLDRGSRPQRLPIDVADVGNAGMAAKLLVALDARFIDRLGLRVSAYGVVAWAGSPTAAVGVALEPSWVMNGGPP